MRIKSLTQYLILVLFLILIYSYHSIDFGAPETDKVFITITTFFFSIFTGFFITRQGARYTKIREIISTYDGKMSGIFRVTQNISSQLQQEVGAIITEHYTKLLETRSWDYHFTHPSKTITRIQQALEKTVGSNKQESLQNQSVGRVLTNLGDCQVLRKNMVMISQEKIPFFQWVLIFIFVFVLLGTVSVIPSAGFLFGSILKAAFVCSILSVVMILHHLDDLHLFEEFAGENSAKDVLATIAGKR